MDAASGLNKIDHVTGKILQLRILVIPITRSGFIRSLDLPNAMG